MRHLWWIIATLIFLTSCATFEQASSPPEPPPTSVATVKKTLPQPQPPVEIGPPNIALEKKQRPMVLVLPPEIDISRPTVSYDLPVVINPPVQAWIDYFTGPGRQAFTRGLERSTIYLPMIRQVFDENGLPRDLAYLSMIESNFMVKAVSRARAVGLWQFMSCTGRRYGLTIDRWVDERRHPEKATRAAAAYLKDLHEMFGSWNLALAAYNAGEGKIQRALDKYQAYRFWEIADKRYLHKETRDFVPKFLAALILAKNPAQFGFEDIAYQDPPDMETVHVPKPVKLSVLAKLCGTSTDVIRELNPQLRQGCTPLGQTDYALNVPGGTSDRFKAEYARLRPADLLPGHTHRIARGETLGVIARRYGVSADDIMAVNNLRSTRIIAGRTLLVPGAETPTPAVQMARSKAVVPSDDAARTYYVVRPGDTAYGIATRHGLKWQDVAAWNGIRDARKLHVGQKLVLYQTETETTLASAKPQAVKRRRPDAASARTTASRQSEIQTVSYTVRSGDTLWNISRRFNMEPREIRNLNNLKGNLIRPGDVLTLRTERL